MARFHNINGTRVQFTAEEETARDAEEKAWADKAPTRRMNRLREQRDALLAETDWMANSDVTMSDAWKTYRDDRLSNITFPTKPS